MSVIGDPELLAVLPRQQQSMSMLIDALGSAPGGEVAIVSVTACSLLIEHEQFERPGGALYRALKAGSRGRLIVLDPTCAEAELRMSIESPGLEQHDSVLSSDARVALEHLDTAWSALAGRFTVRQSAVGLGFNLWLTPTVARVEPYHLGQTPERREDPRAPFEGLVHLWFGRSRPEYVLLADHFEQLWARSSERWPAGRVSCP